MGAHLANFAHKAFGYHRDTTTALRAAGFENEAAAGTWTIGITAEPRPAVSELALIRQIRQVRADLTLTTARYIAHRAKDRTA